MQRPSKDEQSGPARSSSRLPDAAGRGMNLLVLLLSLAVVLGGLEAALRLLTREGRVLGTRLVGAGLIDGERIRLEAPRLMSIYDPELGWTSLPEGGTPGTRSGERYAPWAPPGVVRVCAFGESFTRGDGVEAGDAWPAQLTRHSGGRPLEVLNFGVGGYGLDQAYLCFRRHAPSFHPDVVLLGLTPHALERLTNLYRPFYSHDTGIALAKPRFVLEGDSLRLVLAEMPRPAAFVEEIPRFRRHPLRVYECYYDPALYESSWMDRSRLLWFVRSRLAWRRRLERFAGERHMAPASEEMALARALVLAMARESRALDARFAAVILPTHRLLRLQAAGRDLWAPLRAQLAAAGIPCCDARGAFAGDPEFSRCFLGDGHLNRAGNARVAAAVAEFLETGILNALEDDSAAGSY